jgi:hypothetical protein
MFDYVKLDLRNCSLWRDYGFMWFHVVFNTQAWPMSPETKWMGMSQTHQHMGIERTKSSNSWERLGKPTGEEKLMMVDAWAARGCTS